jgi:uncharacterized ion transporter superfamily protein YfcC
LSDPPVDIEYVTDAVLVPRLRCPRCASTVRQIRQELTARQQLTLFLFGEPLCWLVFGIAAVFGFLAQAVWAVVLASLILGIPALVWLYFSRLRKAQFQCSGCRSLSSYREARFGA